MSLLRFAHRSALALLVTTSFFGCPGNAPKPTAQAPENAPATSPSGESLFQTHCSVCHQQDGRGLAGSYPPLDGSEWLAGSAEAPISIVLMGFEGEVSVKGESFNSEMPTLGADLKDAEIASILTYVRGSWNNSASEVTAAEVAAVRKRLEKRKTPWSGEAELRKFLGDKAPGESV